MNNATLTHFRNLASDLSSRPRILIDITLKSGSVKHAKYDPLFKTITMGGMTFPESELSIWTKMCWGSTPHSIETKSPAPVTKMEV